MSQQRVVVRDIDWPALFPWLLLFRVPRLSIKSPLLLALIGVLAMPIGWRVADGLFIRENGENQTRQERETHRLADRYGTWPGQVGRFSVADARDRFADPKFEAMRVGEPVRTLLDPTVELTRYAHSLFGTLWNLAIWALLGGAISRIACVELGREQRVGLLDALRFARRRYLSYFLAPLFPVAGIALMALPIAFLGLFMWPAPSLGTLLAGLFWWLVLIVTFLMAILVLGLLFGWPLMWGVVSCEKEGDVFEAFSSSYAYTFQQPLRYLGYAAVSLLLGGLAWIVLDGFSDAVVSLAYWGLAWGSGWERIEQLQLAMRNGESAGLLSGGIALMRFFEILVRCVAVAFLYSYFWCGASAIYLLLRRDVDQAELDEVHLDEPEPAELPPLKPDADGVPQIEVPSGETAPTDGEVPLTDEDFERPSERPVAETTEASPTAGSAETDGQPTGDAADDDGPATPAEGRLEETPEPESAAAEPEQDGLEADRETGSEEKRP